MSQNLESLDALVVLGAGKSESKRRARYAAVISIPYDFPIIVSGGRVKFQLPFSFVSNYKTEAEYMRDELELWGVESRRIISENTAFSTLDNLQNSGKILKDFSKIKNVGLVTSHAHMRRALKLAGEELKEYNIIPYPVEIVRINDILAETATYLIEAVNYGIHLAGNRHGLSAITRQL